MSFDTDDFSAKSKSREKKSKKSKKVDDAIQAQSLERMEALLAQAAKGIHVLFDNKTIAQTLQKDSNVEPESLEQVKVVQETMTQLIARKTYFEKMAFLQGLDGQTHHLIMKAYLQIVENTVRVQQDLAH